MPLPIRSRPLLDVDLPTLVEISNQAFPSLAEGELITKLVRDPHFQRSYSLVGELNGKAVGYVMFSTCWIAPKDCPRELASPALALAPLAVLPDYQRSGVGSVLVRHALKAIAAEGQASIIVLGDPEYYRRFGFLPASNEGVFAPFDVPDSAFQIMTLPPGETVQSGVVSYCEAFL